MIPIGCRSCTVCYKFSLSLLLEKMRNEINKEHTLYCLKGSKALLLIRDQCLFYTSGALTSRWAKKMDVVFALENGFRNIERGFLRSYYLYVIQTRAPRGTDRSPEYNEHFCYKLDSRVKNLTTEWNQKQQRFITHASRSLLWIRFVAVAFRSKEEVFWRRGPPPPRVSYFVSPWFRPWANMAKISLCMCQAMSTSSLPSFVNIH